MIQLATGRYRTFTPDLGTPVAISFGRPKFPIRYKIAAEVKALYPWGLFHINDEAEFTDRYRARLDEKVGADRLRAEFERIAAEHPEPLVLLCFEDVRKPGDWCHRRVAARWLEDNGFGEVPEVTL